MFKRHARRREPMGRSESPTTLLDFSAAEAKCRLNTAQLPTQGLSSRALPSLAAPRCLPTGQMQPPAKNTGLFMQQGSVQAVCCAFHAMSAKEAQPKRNEETFALWTLTSVTPVSQRSAVYHFVSTDGARGTPYTRGKGHTVWHKTWHTTVQTADGVARDYTPISTWEQWDAGECDLLVHRRPSEAAASSRLHKQPLGSDVRFSTPKTTLQVPSLMHPHQFNASSRDEIVHAGILLVMGGASGLSTAAQVLQHADATTCFGAGAERAPPLQGPVHLIYACERDDVCMPGELAGWCAAEDGARARLRRLVLAISTPPAAPPEAKDDAPLDLGPLEALENVRILQDGESSPVITGELLQAELAPLRALGRCRVVVSGPASFNAAVTQILEAQCNVGPDAITIVAAEAGDNAPDSEQ